MEGALLLSSPALPLQVLDGHENTLDASREAEGGPAKQSTLDSFLKRCHGAPGGLSPSSKMPRN